MSFIRAFSVRPTLTVNFSHYTASAYKEFYWEMIVKVLLLTMFLCSVVAREERRRRSVFDVIPGVESSGGAGEDGYNGRDSAHGAHCRSGGDTLQVQGRLQTLYQGTLISSYLT